MLCSSAHHACSALLQESVHEVELCTVALTCQFFVGRVTFVRGERSFSRGFLACGWCPLLHFFAERSPIEERLQQYGEGCERHVQVS